MQQNSLVQDIKKKVDIVDLVQEYLPLKPSGKNFFALSPFKEEKTPSFCVNPEKQTYYCYASGQGGDIFSFIQEMEKVEFKEALQLIADRYGIVLKKNDFSGGKTIDRNEQSYTKNDLYKFLEQLTNYYQSLLYKEEGKKALNYLKGRGISEASIKKFRLGYSRESFNDLSLWAKGKGIPLEILIGSGVLNSKDNKKFYDRFYGRLMFPIMDEQGKTISFSSRALDKNVKQAKYINGPETSLFKKSRVFYGLNEAKNAYKKANRLLVCEGQIDVITCHQVGVKETICVQGTAFTNEHARKLSRYTKDITLAFDGDDAGQLAMERSVDALLSLNIVPNIISMPQASDPNSFFLEYGAEKVLNCLKEEKDYFNFCLQEIYQKSPLQDSPKFKANFFSKIVGKLSLLSDDIIQSVFIEKMSSFFLLAPEEIKKLITKKKTKSLVRNSPSPVANQEEEYLQSELHLFDLAFHYENIAHEILKELNFSFLSSFKSGQLLRDFLTSLSDFSWEDAKRDVFQEYQKDSKIARLFIGSGYHKNLKQVKKDCLLALEKAKLERDLKEARGNLKIIQEIIPKLNKINELIKDHTR